MTLPSIVPGPGPVMLAAKGPGFTVSAYVAVDGVVTLTRIPFPGSFSEAQKWSSK